MVDFKTGLMTAIVLLHMIQALAQNGPIVLDGAFDDWITIEGLEDAVTEGSPAVDLVEMKVTSDADHLYVYVRLASDLDLTDVLYPHNLFLQIDVDMDASTGYPVREGFGSELGIDFNSLFAYTNFGPADQVNFSEIGFIPSPTVTSKEFEFALRRDVVLEGGDALFPQDSIVFYSETPNLTTTFLMWGIVRLRFQRCQRGRSRPHRLGQGPPIPSACLCVQCARQRSHSSSSPIALRTDRPRLEC